MNKDVFYWGFIVLLLFLLFEVIPYCVLYEIIHTEGFIIGAYYSWNKLGAIVILSSDCCTCVAPCCLQISPESCRQSNGERKRMRRGKCMQILGARWISAAAAVCQGQMWLPDFWALTFRNCDVIHQEIFGSEKPIIGNTTFNAITFWIFLKPDTRVLIIIIKGDYPSFKSAFCYPVFHHCVRFCTLETLLSLVINHRHHQLLLLPNVWYCLVMLCRLLEVIIQSGHIEIKMIKIKVHKQVFYISEYTTTKPIPFQTVKKC